MHKVVETVLWFVCGVLPWLFGVYHILTLPLRYV
jgi:hypothetical protein